MENEELDEKAQRQVTEIRKERRKDKD